MVKVPRKQRAGSAGGVGQGTDTHTEMAGRGLLGDTAKYRITGQVNSL